MANESLTDLLLPLAAFGGTLAGSLGNYHVGPQASSMAINGLQMLSSLQYRDEQERQHRVSQLMQLADNAAKVGNVELARQIDAELQALGAKAIVTPLAETYKQKGEQADQLFQSLGFNIGQPDAITASPFAPALPLQSSGQLLPMPAGQASPTRPVVQPNPAQALPPLDRGNLLSQVHALDEQINAAPSGSDERARLIERQNRLAQQLPAESGQEPPMQPIVPIPEGVDQSAIADELQASQAIQGQGAQPMALPQIRVPVPGDVPPVRPVPPGTLNLKHPFRDLNVSITPEGTTARNEEQARQYFQAQVANGIPPIQALQRLDAGGYGKFTKDLWSQAFMQTYTQLRDYYAASGDPFANERAFERASSLTGGKGIDPQAFSTFGKRPSMEDVRGRAFMGQLPTSPQEIQKNIIEPYDTYERERGVKKVAEEELARGRAKTTTELERPIGLEGGSANYVRLAPGGIIEQAPAEGLPVSKIFEQGYVKLPPGKQKDVEGYAHMQMLTGKINRMEEYAREFTKAAPGLFNRGAQAFNNFMAEMGQDGRLTDVLDENGKRMRLGQVISAYEREKKAFLGEVAKAVRGEVGTLTNQDIARQLMQFASISDTRGVSEALFRDMKRDLFNGMLQQATGIFGAQKAWEALQSVNPLLQMPQAAPQPFVPPMPQAPPPPAFRPAPEPSRLPEAPQMEQPRSQPKKKGPTIDRQRLLELEPR